MALLVADVGGTNSRLAFASDQGVQADSIRHFKNADFESVYDVINAYLIDAKKPVSICCVAMAGPVVAQKGKLTNLNWEISADQLCIASGSQQALLMNDLTALGYAVGPLAADETRTVCGTQNPAPQNGQSLVIGMGTGFNVCPVKVSGSGEIVCLEAEAGHTAMTKAMADRLEDLVGSEAARFTTIEECFAGPGLSRLYAAFTKSLPLDAREIITACRDGTDPRAAEFLQSISALLGALCKQMVLQYMPLDGVYFAGSVARGLFSCGYDSEFASALQSEGDFSAQFSDIQVSVIDTDTAPLLGCAAAAQALQVT